MLKNSASCAIIALGKIVFHPTDLRDAGTFAAFATVERAAIARGMRKARAGRADLGFFGPDFADFDFRGAGVVYLTPRAPGKSRQAKKFWKWKMEF